MAVLSSNLVFNPSAEASGTGLVCQSTEEAEIIAIALTDRIIAK